MDELTRIAFTRDELRRVEFFECGDDRWCKAASAWISNAPPFSGALVSIEKFGNAVWLYLLNELVVGFGSLGTTRWNWPLPDGPVTTIGYIPMMAVHKDFHGQPENGKTFAQQILTDLITESVALGHIALGLQVDTENVAARKLYDRCGFSLSPGVYERYGCRFHRMCIQHTTPDKLGA